MKVQILVDGQVVNTQIVSETLHEGATYMDFKRIALQAALADKAVRISDSLRATFKMFDLSGDEIDEASREPSRHFGA